MCDNISTHHLVKNPFFHERTKHIEVDFCFVREQVASKALEVCYVPAEDQVPDAPIKALPTA